ncbi:MAG: valine--tRNA ligase [Candidatus Kerfeldbacteria bacterium]|nr:valine--tRNA ligase [Candidatus Kerfeldbacteria bacterium]
MKPLEKAYEPQSIEQAIYQRWERSGFFNPDKLPGKRTKTFSVAMPPPNVTGELHLGHATGITIQDILTRFYRMRGYKALYLPGTDHAGISTQVMVERLIAESGLDRHTLGREAFLKHVWDWKKKYGSRITEQIRQLGASCDWSREHFTMDPKLTEAVQHAFITMYKDGLIYRGNRIVNWDPKSRTALSDLEVKHVETTSKLYYIKYPLFGSTKYVTVATTRPETMLGDTAVAVNPDDARYKEYIGKSVLIPIVNREVPIITDKRVDPAFGTGAVKVTPAHDPLDYEIGQDHHLPIINIIGMDGMLTKEAGEYYGKSVQQARQLIIQRLDEEELLEKTIDYLHNQARSERTSAPIEPLISRQWFVKMDKLAAAGLRAVKQKKIAIIPDRFDKVYTHWLENIKDWCISRQLWWGHQIPIWYKGDEVRASIKKPGNGWVQDEDTLDTWFSSGLWTFATLGWPKRGTADLKRYHPTTVMETGWDLIFFWVARMIMLSLYFTKSIPFKTVYLHGMVLDKDGKKMSKSKGTGVDPIPMTQKYGTDAIRLSLILGTTPGQDFRLYEEKIAGYRNFINKLWNVARYVLAHPKTKEPLRLTTLADQWIMSRLQGLITTVTTHIESYNFSEAGTALYDFLWRELADWYIELSKSHLNVPLLYHILETFLALAHPYMPYVTEEVWSRLSGTEKKSMLIVHAWPQAQRRYHNTEAEKKFTTLQDFVGSIRNIRAEEKISPTTLIDAVISGKRQSVIIEHQESIMRLARLKSLTASPITKPTGTITGLDFALDYTRDDTSINKELHQLSEYIQRLEQKLSNANFIDHAPEAVIEGEREKLAEARERLQSLTRG